MKPKPRYKLKLSKLEFISPVDLPAQETATVRLIKRADGTGPALDGKARVAKFNDELGLVFLWAFTNTSPDGADYYDLQGDNIDTDFMKAALDFMADGGLTDEMHDGEPDGWTPFCLPITRETADAYGVTTKTYGLAVAIKPSAAVFAKFKSGEYVAVSIAGAGERTAVKQAPATKSAPPRVVKQAAVTGEVDGHVHALSVEDPGCEWIGTLNTSWGTSEGAPSSHGHVWTYDDKTGAITIAADSGHTHPIDAVVPAAVLAIARGRAALRTLEQAADVAAVGAALVEEVVEGAAAGTVSISIAARAPAANSTPAAPPAIVAPHQETRMPILRKHLAAAFLLSDAERAHVATIPEEADQVSFLEKSAPDRAAIVKAALDADPIVHTTTDGLVIRKSAGETALAFAKRSDAQDALLKAQATEIAKATAETERVTLEKRATTELAHFSKGAIANVDIRTIILKAFEVGILDAAQRAEALVVMKGAGAALAMLGKANGVNPESPQGPDDPANVLKTAVVKYQVDHKLPSYEAALAAATQHDPAIRDLWNASLS